MTHHAFVCDALRTRFGRRCALCAMGIGVGQGIALVLERW
jgi:hypothetical protein